jgi:mono/diheme cytochrome c family protein
MVFAFTLRQISTTGKSVAELAAFIFGAFALHWSERQRFPIRSAAIVMSALVGLIAGCTRRDALIYTPSQELAELPAEQQQEVTKLLTQFYGTVSHPTLMVLAENPSESQASDEQGEGLTLESKLDRDHLRRGAEVYQARCAACHGTTGDGQGPAAEFLDPKPRDYRRGLFKFTSTGRNKPRKADLVRTVKYGARGTSMPSFRWLSPDDLSAVVDYVIVLAQRGETESKLVVLAQDEELDPQYAAEDAKAVYDAWVEAPTKLVQQATPPPPMTEETIASGRHAFLVKGCAKCHGTDGRGNPNEPLKDDWGNPLFAANLTSGMLHGGRRDEDIYRRIYSGINGTPMPAFGPEFSPTFVDQPETIWHLVHFVRALADGREFPAVTMEEANRMAEEEAQKNAPMPEVEAGTDAETAPAAESAPTSESESDSPATDESTNESSDETATD